MSILQDYIKFHLLFFEKKNDEKIKHRFYTTISLLSNSVFVNLSEIVNIQITFISDLQFIKKYTAVKEYRFSNDIP